MKKDALEIYAKHLVETAKLPETENPELTDARLEVAGAMWTHRQEALASALERLNLHAQKPGEEIAALFISYRTARITFDSVAHRTEFERKNGIGFGGGGRGSPG